MNKIAVYGGLGNQMFQYALNIALNKKGISTKISFSGFLYNHHHNGFNLAKAFKLKIPFGLKLQQFFILNGGIIYNNKIAAFFFRNIITVLNKYFYKIYTEKKEFEYDYDIFLQRSTFFVGVWQVEAYFKAIEKDIFEAFTFKVPTDKKNKSIINAINNCNAVSVHIRRGDYLNENWAAKLVVIKNNTYYNNALKYIVEKVDNPQFFIFSDDVAWVKENLKIPDGIYVDFNKGQSSYIDMYLMSLCKHNIIANSSFSWWGAWLNKNSNKIVVMPSKWFNRDYCDGIFPTEWVTIDV